MFVYDHMKHNFPLPQLQKKNYDKKFYWTSILFPASSFHIFQLLSFQEKLNLRIRIGFLCPYQFCLNHPELRERFNELYKWLVTKPSASSDKVNWISSHWHTHDTYISNTQSKMHQVEERIKVLSQKFENSDITNSDLSKFTVVKKYRSADKKWIKHVLMLSAFVLVVTTFRNVGFTNNSEVNSVHSFFISKLFYVPPIYYYSIIR